MDYWTYPAPDVDPPDTQKALLEQDWRLREARRVRARQAAAGRDSELELMDTLHDNCDPRVHTDVPPLFATSPGAALTF